MAAPAFQSVQSSDTGIQTSGTRNVTKPDNLAVGDLMIGFSTNNSGTGTTHPTGFTTLGTEDNTAGIRTQISYKIADSNDVAATDFQFTTCGFASITRVTGHGGAGSIVYADAQQTNSASFSQAGLTPRDYGDSVLLMMYLTFVNGSSGTVANYAIATSNPSWSERDNYPGANSNGTALATATRPEVTATGNFSGNGAGGIGADWTGHLLAIAVENTVTTAESTTLTEVVAKDVTTPISDSVSLLETVSKTANRYTNRTKSASTWSNQPKL